MFTLAASNAWDVDCCDDIPCDCESVCHVASLSKITEQLKVLFGVTVGHSVLVASQSPDSEGRRI